ncbi:PTS system beta-glucoside-specific IIB/C/A component [Lactococcus lactis subsp. lactis]|uniref:Uncharacterized protein n=2 Tax=Lactococcus lactis TaxID=1358 RepID=A0A2A5S788_LACLH|nr:PTS system beta-glucoside-specific IIB/C/A component [Lactococcus lactis subsp. lactis]PCS09281.1 hypothetical protein RU90_GL002159 [Lactococcus lactis subsp. hordniae]
MTKLASGTDFIGIGLQNISYASQVFPSILTVLFYSQMEHLFNRFSPKPIRIFFVPIMCLLITVPISLIILGPIGYNIGGVLIVVIVWLYNHLEWVATALLAALLPFMVVTGMHKAMIPYAVASMSKLGTELLYLPASLAHNISESGACFAVALKTKDKSLRSTSISAAISASFGITEPALYGVTILNKRVLYSVMLSSLIGGGIAGLFALKAFALVGPGIVSITMFIDPENILNIVWALLTLGVSFVISFISVLVIYKERTISEEQTSESDSSLSLSSPAKGRVISLTKVKDDVFSSGLMGEGVAIVPELGELVAPGDGEITMLFATNHALGLTTPDGRDTAADGTIYAGDYENNSIRSINPDGTMETIIHGPQILWPDTLSIGADKYLYFTSNQLQRQSGFHYVKDLREKPYSLFRVFIDKEPANQN